jgi:phosphatidylglycerophosphatase C
MIRRFLANMSRDQLERISKRFCSNRLPQLMNPVALDRLNWHRVEGHRIIVLSASPEVYLTVWAFENGLTEVLATRLQFFGDRVTGLIDGENCRGSEKVKRLEAYLGQLNEFIMFAYGDSPADLELLGRADFPYYRTFLPPQTIKRWFRSSFEFLKATI